MAKAALTSESGALEQRLTSLVLLIYVAGMSWPVRYGEVHMQLLEFLEGLSPPTSE